MTHVPMAEVHLPLSTFLELEFHLLETRPGVKTGAFVTELVQRWLTVETERLALRRSGPPMHGFQWKNVFLPDGTQLRTDYQQSQEFAKVTHNRIRTDDGISLTPSMFANRHTKGRNGWRFIWLRFPGEDYWVRAADYRRHVEKQKQSQSV